MIFKSKSGHINSKFHKRKERLAFTVKQYEFKKPKITQIDNTLKDVIKDCKDKYFHTFEFRCEYEIIFKLKTFGEVFYLTILNDFKQLLSETERVLKKLMSTKTMIVNSMK